MLQGSIYKEVNQHDHMTDGAFEIRRHLADYAARIWISLQWTRLKSRIAHSWQNKLPHIVTVGCVGSSKHSLQLKRFADGVVCGLGTIFDYQKVLSQESTTRDVPSVARISAFSVICGTIWSVLDLSVATTFSTELSSARLSSSTGLATARIPRVKMKAKKEATRENNMI